MSDARQTSFLRGKAFTHGPLQTIEPRTIMVPAHSQDLHYEPVSVARMSFDVETDAAAVQPEIVVAPTCRIIRIGDRRIIDWRGFAPDPSLPAPSRSALHQRDVAK